MKNILRSGAVLAVVLGLAGCGNKGGDSAMAEFKSLKDKMCACKDAECAKKVSDEMAKMGDKYKNAKVDEKQLKEAAKLTEELTQCMTKAMGGGGGAEPAPPANP